MLSGRYGPHVVIVTLYQYHYTLLLAGNHGLYTFSCSLPCLLGLIPILQIRSLGMRLAPLIPLSTFLK